MFIFTHPLWGPLLIRMKWLIFNIMKIIIYNFQYYLPPLLTPTNPETKLLLSPYVHHQWSTVVPQGGRWRHRFSSLLYSGFSVHQFLLWQHPVDSQDQMPQSLFYLHKDHASIKQFFLQCLHFNLLLTLNSDDSNDMACYAYCWPVMVNWWTLIMHKTCRCCGSRQQQHVIAINHAIPRITDHNENMFPNV